MQHVWPARRRANGSLSCLGLDVCLSEIPCCSDSGYLLPQPFKSNCWLSVGTLWPILWLTDDIPLPSSNSSFLTLPNLAWLWKHTLYSVESSNNDSKTARFIKPSTYAHGPWHSAEWGRMKIARDKLALLAICLKLWWQLRMMPTMENLIPDSGWIFPHVAKGWILRGPVLFLCFQN